MEHQKGVEFQHIPTLTAAEAWAIAVAARDPAYGPDDARQDLALALVLGKVDPAGNPAGWAFRRAQRCGMARPVTVSLDVPMGDPDGPCLVDLLADEDAGISVGEVEGEDDWRSQELPALAGMYGRLAQLARRGKSVDEIAATLRLTPRRIRQLLEDAEGIRRSVREAESDLFGWEDE